MGDCHAVARLNDAFRQTFTGGKVVTTASLATRSDLSQILDKVKRFEAFNEDNDPYRERDFGAFDHDGQRLFWKIDYFDPELEMHSPDPADPAVTCRVLTIMLAEEY